MVNEKYELTVTNTEHEEGETHIGYGIRCGAHMVFDISADREKIESLIERMNANKLSPLHMMDVIEDFLAQDSDFFFR